MHSEDVGRGGMRYKMCTHSTMSMTSIENEIGYPFGSMDYYVDDCQDGGKPLMLLSHLQINVQNARSSNHISLAIRKYVLNLPGYPKAHRMSRVISCTLLTYWLTSLLSFLLLLVLWCIRLPGPDERGNPMVDPRVTLMGRLVPVEEVKVNISCCFLFVCWGGNAKDYLMDVFVLLFSWESLFVCVLV